VRYEVEQKMRVCWPLGVGFLLFYVEEQIEIIKEGAIFFRLDILPFAIFPTHLKLRILFDGLSHEVFVPAWHLFVH
jgi:hypothetical protein